MSALVYTYQKRHCSFVFSQFVYLKESFCPSLDEKISVLYEVGCPATIAANPFCYFLWMHSVHLLLVL